MRTLLIVISIAFLSGCQKSNESNNSSTGIPGSTSRFTIVGNTLYTVDNKSLNIFDISNVTTLTRTGKLDVGFDIETIFSRDDSTLFIGSSSGMYIYSIKNNSAPEFLSVFTHVYSCDPVVANQNYAYVTLRSGSTRCGRFANELKVIDIKNLTRPFEVKSYEMSAPRGLGIDDNKVFVCDNGLKVFETNDGFNLTQTHFYPINCLDVIPRDSILAVVGDDGLYQYNYNQNMKLLSKISF